MQDIEEQRGKKKSRGSVHREMVRQGFKPFHVIKKPLVTELQEEDRMWVCSEFLSEWDLDDFMQSTK